MEGITDFVGGGGRTDTPTQKRRREPLLSCSLSADRTLLCQKSIMIAAEPALSGEFPAGKKVGSGGLGTGFDLGTVKTKSVKAHRLVNYAVASLCAACPIFNI